MSEVRDAIRSAFFSQKPKTQIVNVLGYDIELRQPPIASVLTLNTGEDRIQGMLRTLVNYCFVPGTSEHVFELEDLEALKESPFSDAWTQLTNAINTLIDLGALQKEAEKK